MTTRRSEAAPPSSTLTAGIPLSDLKDWQGATLDDVTNASQAYVNEVAAVNQEMANFLQTRLRHDIELGEALSRCRTLADATKLQGDWLKQAMNDYTAEAQKLFELGSTLMRGGWTPMEKSKAAPKADQSGATKPQPK